MAVHLDSIASNESMRTKPSRLPLLSLDRSVQLFPAHLTRLATFVVDAPDLTRSHLMHLSDHGNNHTKDMSQRTGQSTAPKGSNSNVFPSFTPGSKEFVPPYFLHPNMFHLISKSIPSLGKEALINEFHLERVTYLHIKLRSLLTADKIQIRGDLCICKSWSKYREGCAG